jgi:hypothetical protein
LTWLGLVTLATASVGLSTGLIPWQPQTVAWIIYTIDPRYWPLWLAFVFWGAVCWRLIDLPCWSNAIRSKERRIKSLIVAAVFLLIAVQNEWYNVAIYMVTENWLYRMVYEPYIVGPLALYMGDGYWSWKTFIAPTLGLILLGTMIRLIVYLRKKRNEQGPKTEK